MNYCTVSGDPSGLQVFHFIMYINAEYGTEDQQRCGVVQFYQADSYQLYTAVLHIAKLMLRVIGEQTVLIVSVLNNFGM